MAACKIGILVGSIARDSLNRRLANALVKLAPAGLEFREIPIRDLPLYSYDYDKDFPPAARAFKEALAGVGAILIVTPEYNRSIPGALKNAIDWASRPHGTNALARKPSAVIGASTGRIGTAIAQQHLRGVLGYCNSPQMNAPEAYIQIAKDGFDADGNVIDAATREFLAKFMRAYQAFLDMVVPCVTSPAS